MRRAARPVRVAALVCAVALGTAGCATGLSAQTTTRYNAPVGTDARDGDVKALNVLVVAAEDGSGTLVASLVNTAGEDDTLVAAQATETGDWSGGPREEVDADAQGGALEVTGLAPTTLEPGVVVQLADADEPVAITGTGVSEGGVIEVTLTFETAGPLTLEVPVVPRHVEYEDVPTPPTPTPPTETDGAAAAGEGDG